jgi:hypothetical protein
MKREREEEIEIEKGGERIEEWLPEIIVAEGHATIIQSCLNYLNLEELDHFKKRRQILPSAADDSVRDGIYRNRQIPFSFSAAGSRRSSDDGSGGLALGAMRTDPGEIQSLECIQTKGQLQEEPVMNWLSGTEFFWLSSVLEEWSERRHPEPKQSSALPSVRHSQENPADSSIRRAERHEREEVWSSDIALSLSTRGVCRKAATGDIYSLFQYSSDEIFTHASNTELQSDEIFTHASNTELQSARLVWLVDSLIEAWGHVVILREDLRKKASFLQFCIEAETLDSLVLPVLEPVSCRSTALEVLIPAMVLIKDDIIRDLVLCQIKAQSIHDEYVAKRVTKREADRMGKLKGDGLEQNTPPLIDGSSLHRANYCGLLISLLKPDEHTTRLATTPISRVDAFGMWESHIHALLREGKLSVHTICRLLEKRLPESPLEIAFCIPESSPDILRAIIVMGAYSEKEMVD